jgi:hypothetical protein
MGTEMTNNQTTCHSGARPRFIEDLSRILLYVSPSGKGGLKGIF